MKHSMVYFSCAVCLHLCLHALLFCTAALLSIPDHALAAAAACVAAASGSSGPVQAPVLRKTLPGSWDENWLASPAVADINGDGKFEIIAPRHSVLYVWRNDGTLLWKTAFGYSASSSPEHGTTRMWPSAVVGDFNRDGRLEIAVAGGIEDNLGINLCLYDGSGNVLSGWPKRFGDLEVRSIAAADVDGDGKIEILVNKTGEGPVTTVYRHEGTQLANWPQVTASCNPPAPAEQCWDFGGYNQNIGAADLDGDGIPDVISTYDAIGFGVFKGNGAPFPTAPEFSDRVVTAVEAYHDITLSRQGWGTGDRSEFTSSPPVMADLFGDGEPRIILAGDHEHSQSTDNKGITVWVLNRDLRRPAGWEWPKDTGLPLGGSGDLGPNIVPTMPSPSVANLDGSTSLKILAPGYDGKLHVYNSNGTLYWEYAFSTTASPYTGASEALVADLNGDGSPEVIFTTFSSGDFGKPDTPAHLVILSSTGALLHEVQLPGRGSMAAPTVADIDGDGKPEIIVSLKDSVGGGKGGVQIYDVPGASDNCVMWGTGRGGLLRQGSYQPPIGASSTPSLTLTPVTTPTNLSSQTISGATEADATVTVATDSAASDGTATVIGSGWSYAITGLTWGANNVTVTAMDGAGRKSLKNTSITRSPKLDVVLAGSGGGLVTSEPQGIHCPAGECFRLFAFNSPVTLFAYPDTNSLFSGWSACAGQADCAVTMDNDKSVSALFNYVKPARIPSNPPAYYTLIGDAYAHLPAGGTIQVREFLFDEELTLNRSLAVTIEGGYDLGYSGRNGFATLKGCLIVQSGSLQVEGVEVR
jgi:hypothetical protein